MIRFAFAILATLAIALPASPDSSIDSRIAQLTGQMPQSVDQKIAALKADVQAINDRLDKLFAKSEVDPFSSVQAKGLTITCPGCKCGCAVTGVCTCANMQPMAAATIAQTPVQYQRAWVQTGRRSGYWSMEPVSDQGFQGASISACSGGSCSVGRRR